MKNVLFLFIVLISLSSCKKDAYSGEGYNLFFFPRKVKNVFITPGEQHFSYYQEVKQIDYFRLESDTVTEDQFFISVLTSNYDPRPDLFKDNPNYDPKSSMPVGYPYSFDNLDDPIPSVEQQIKSDYDRQAQTYSKGGNNDVMISIEYRTTEIKNLTISTTNTPLFGKSAGASLNDFFTAVLYDPPVIISAPTERLVYGYSSKEYPASIDEWLSVSPFGQATMLLVPNKKIEGLPLNVQFAVKMETAEGLVLSDTTRVITITDAY